MRKQCAIVTASNRRLVRQTLSSDEGLTLVEILVVLSIVAMMATLAAPRMVGYLSGARADTARTQIRNVETALELFAIDVGRFPTEQEGLTALITSPQAATKWNGPYLKRQSALEDPWGKRFTYKIDASSLLPTITSLGADGEVGGSNENEDISNNITNEETADNS